jgi:hypothetical protein
LQPRGVSVTRFNTGVLEMTVPTAWAKAGVVSAAAETIADASVENFRI